MLILVQIFVILCVSEICISFRFFTYVCIVFSGLVLINQVKLNENEKCYIGNLLKYFISNVFILLLLLLFYS